MVLHLQYRLARNADDVVWTLGMLLIRDLEVFVVLFHNREASSIWFVVFEPIHHLLDADPNSTVSVLLSVPEVNSRLVLALGRERFERNHLLDGHVLSEVVEGFALGLEVGKRAFLCVRGEIVLMGGVGDELLTSGKDAEEVQVIFRFTPSLTWIL